MPTENNAIGRVQTMKAEVTNTECWSVWWNTGDLFWLAVDNLLAAPSCFLTIQQIIVYIAMNKAWVDSTMNPIISAVMRNTLMMLNTKDRIQIVPIEMLENLDVMRSRDFIGHNTAKIRINVMYSKWNRDERMEYCNITLTTLLMSELNCSSELCRRCQ